MFFWGGRATLDKQTKSHESEQGIEYQQLVTEMIAVEPSLRMAVQHPTEQGRGQGHEGYPAVAHRPFYQYAKGKEAQYGAVSVAGKGVNGVYHAGVVQ